jgi:alpha-N-arabinofuranosidase
MNNRSKAKYYFFWFAGFLMIVLNGCDLKYYGKPDVILEIDINKPGKALRTDLYVTGIKDVIDSEATEEKSYKGTLYAALLIAHSLIWLENNPDTVKPAFVTLPEMIQDKKVSFSNPLDYAEKIFTESRPDQVLATKVTLSSSTLNEGKLLPLINATAGIQDKSGLVIIKIVNLLNTPKLCKIVLSYKQQIKYKGEVTVMTSKEVMDMNSIKEPEKVVPMTDVLNGLKNTFKYNCPANSIVIIKVRFRKGINGIGNCC